MKKKKQKARQPGQCIDMVRHPSSGRNIKKFKPNSACTCTVDQAGLVDA